MRAKTLILWLIASCATEATTSNVAETQTPSSNAAPPVATDWNISEFTERIDALYQLYDLKIDNLKKLGALSSDSEKILIEWRAGEVVKICADAKRKLTEDVAKEKISNCR